MFRIRPLVFIASVFLTMMSLSCASTPQGAAGTAGLAVFGTSLAKDLLGEVDGVIAINANRAITQGDAAAGRFADKLGIGAQNFAILFGDQLDKTYSRLDPVARNYLYQLVTLSRQVDSTRADVDEWLASASVDLRTIVGELPLTGETRFLVQKFDGTVFYSGNQELSLGIIGIGVSEQTDKKSSVVTSVTVNGLPVTFKFLPENDKKCVLKISASEVEPHVVNDRFNIVDLTFTSHVRSKGSFGQWREKDYTFRSYVLLVPKNVGVARVTYSTPREGWRVANEDFTNSFTTPNHSQGKKNVFGVPGEIRHFTYSVELNCNVKQRFRPGSATYSFPPEGNQGGWTNLDFGIAAKDRPQPQFLKNDQQVKLDFEVWGKPTTVILHAALEEWAVLGTDVQEASVPIAVGTPASISLPSNATDWQIEGTSLSGKKYYADKAGTRTNCNVLEAAAGEFTKLSATFEVP